MTTNIGTNATSPSKSSVVTWIWSLVCLTILGLSAYYARMGAVSPRIANPEMSGVPRPVEFMFGTDYPIYTMQQIGRAHV